MNTVSMHSPADDTTMTLTGHLTELRRRLIVCIIATVLGMAVSNYFLDEIMAILTAPAGTLYFIKPAEAFFIYFKICLTAGAILSSPVLFYEFWAFLVPAFTHHEKRVLALIVPVSLCLFLGGVLFAFTIVLPQGLRFFMSFSTTSIQPMITMESYLDFVLMLILPFGVMFNLPLLLLILAKADLITSSMLRKKRRFIIFFAFVAAAVITPTTDIVTQTMLAAPIILLYELSRLIIQYVLKK